MMQTITLVVGAYQQNCRIVVNLQSKAALIIDPGDEGNRINQFIAKENYRPVAVLLTHAHLDHINDLDLIRDHWQIPAFMHAEELPVFEALAWQGQMLNMTVHPLRPIDHFLHDRQELHFLEDFIQVLHTPGHSPGGCCYYFPRMEQVIVGDTLFRGSIGRTDFIGGNYQQLLKSIRTQLFSLPPATKVCSGHGPDSTIGEEKTSNPFFVNDKN